MKYRIGWKNNKRQPSETQKIYYVNMKIRQQQNDVRQNKKHKHTHIHKQTHRYMIITVFSF